MTDDVPRLRDAGSEAPLELRELLQAAERDAPSAGELARLAARLGPVLGGAVAAGSAAAPAAGVLKSSVMLKLAALAGFVASVGLGVALGVGSPEPAAPIGRLARAARPLLAATVQPPTPAPTVAPTAASTEAPEPAASKAPRGPGPSEAQLLQQAQAALKSDPARALALAQAHQRRFPAGALAQEREVIAIEAMRRLGRSSDAERRAREFRHDNPDSAHLPRIDRSKPKP